MGSKEEGGGAGEETRSAWDPQWGGRVQGYALSGGNEVSQNGPLARGTHWGIGAGWAKG